MLIFLFGEDTFRSRQKLKELKDKFIREVDFSGNSLIMVNGKTTTIGEIAELIGSGSLLAKKRLLIIEEIFSHKNQDIFGQVADYLKDKKFQKNENIVVFWDSIVKTKKKKNKEEFLIIDDTGRERILAKKSLGLFKYLLGQKYSQQFNFLSNIKAASWVKKEVAGRGAEITAQAAGNLVGLVGNDLWQLNNEIDKLINYKLVDNLNLAGSNSAKILEEDISSLVRGNFDENIFALTDAISNKNKPLAIKLLDEQVAAGLTDSYLLNMFIRQFKILLQIRQAVDSGLTPRKISSQLRLHPFVAQKALTQVRNFNLTALKNIFTQLVNIDFFMKTGRSDVQTMLNMLIAKI